MPNFGLVVFPGSNCDHDCYHVIKHMFKQECEFVWHEEKNLDRFDSIILPGGFSYGDYLRTGAIARFSPVMKAVEKLASEGRPIMGICNGFQILVEAGLLPGALIKNSSLRFVCKWVNIRVENTNTPFTHLMRRGDLLRIPIAHGEGNFFANQDDIRKLTENSQVVFKYCDEEGETTSQSNPNGSIENIAGICNSQGNILGMMPHPERCCEETIGGEDGKAIFESLISWLEKSESQALIRTHV
ncbi:MAG: phosphoribosylformylglycinamidine synthase subunit PurQ [Deltaproteobacteria bacterium]|nr:phosphoribosylformylglycinamidine synthase subunit PurQ [Deltaproteobacteria bacterium]